MRMRWMLCVALLVQGAILTKPAEAGPSSSRVPCQAFGSSPNFAKDRVLFCAAAGSWASNFDGKVLLYRSNDGGRSWGPGRAVVQPTRTQAVDDVWPMGLQPTGRPEVAISVLLSPAFATDKTLFVGTEGSGSFMSTDGGLTFVKVASAVHVSRWGTSVFLDVAPQLGLPMPALAVADQTSNYAGVFTPPLPEWHIISPPGFSPNGVLVAPDWATSRQAVIVGNQRVQTGDAPFDAAPRAYGCDVHFVCMKELYNFGNIGSLEFIETLPMNQGGRDYVTIMTWESMRVFRTRDGGEHWEPWTSLKPLLGDLRLNDRVEIASDPARPKQLFLRVSGMNFERQKSPQEQLFRSDDDGKHWTRIGFAWGPGQKGRQPRSTLPWNMMPLYRTYLSAFQPIVVGPSGQIILTGQRQTGSQINDRGLYCSKDYGRSWSTRC